jgi:hypothetical protein
MGWQMMSNVIQLVSRIDDQSALTTPDMLAQALRADADLAANNAALAAHIVALTSHMIAQDRRIAELEARSPPPRFDPHAGRLTAKQAAFASGFSLATIHRWFRSGAIGGKREGVRIFIDPATLPMRK